MQAMITAGVVGWLLAKWWKVRHSMVWNIVNGCIVLAVFLPGVAVGLRHFTAVG